MTNIERKERIAYWAGVWDSILWVSVAALTTVTVYLALEII